MDFRKILSPEEGSKPPEDANNPETPRDVNNQRRRNGTSDEREQEQHSVAQAGLEPAPAPVSQTFHSRRSVSPRLPSISDTTAQQPVYVQHPGQYPHPQRETEKPPQGSLRPGGQSRKRARDGDDDDDDDDEELTPDAPSKRQSKWTEEENRKIVRLRGSGEKWEKISEQLPGRSAISCRLHYQNFLEKRPEWDEEKLNRLARLYER